jgi:hypothetical protein
VALHITSIQSALHQPQNQYVQVSFYWVLNVSNSPWYSSWLCWLDQACSHIGSMCRGAWVGREWGQLQLAHWRPDQWHYTSPAYSQPYTSHRTSMYR